MSDVASPRDAVLAALPGTLPDLMARTGYPAAMILRQVLNLRAEGIRVNAVEDGVTRNVPAKARPEPDAWTTVYTVEARKENP